MRAGVTIEANNTIFFFGKYTTFAKEKVYLQIPVDVTRVSNSKRNFSRQTSTFFFSLTIFSISSNGHNLFIGAKLGHKNI